MVFPKKTIVLVGIYNQQFQGTIILMVFDFQGIDISIIHSAHLNAWVQNWTSHLRSDQFILVLNCVYIEDEKLPSYV